jgi:hypothetical protein
LSPKEVSVSWNALVSTTTRLDSQEIRATDSSLFYSIQITSGAHSASCTIDNGEGGSFPGGKKNWSLKINAQLRLVPSLRMHETSLYKFIVWCLIKNRDKKNRFTAILYNPDLHK